jgi:hypothetical protein
MVEVKTVKERKPMTYGLQNGGPSYRNLGASLPKIEEFAVCCRCVLSSVQFIQRSGRHIGCQQSSTNRRMIALFSLLGAEAVTENSDQDQLDEYPITASLAALYTQRQSQKGPFPDPRGASAFSIRAAVATAAMQAGVTLLPIPQNTLQPNPVESPLTRSCEAGSTASATSHSIWLLTYAEGVNGEEPARPSIVNMQQDEEELMLWFASCTLGNIAFTPNIVNVSGLPRGATFLPADSITQAVYHFYAHALMNVAIDCSETFGYQCSEIERHMSAPPPDHEQPTTIIQTQRVTPVIERLTRQPSLPSPSFNPGFATILPLRSSVVLA